jgi:hypothetical protein
LAAQLVCSLFSSLSSLLFSLLLALLSRIDQENEFHFRGCWISSRKESGISRRKESGRTGEKRAVEQESFSKVTVIQPVTLAAQLVCSLFSSLSSLLFSLLSVLLTSGSPFQEQEKEFHFRGCGISLIPMMDLDFHRGFRNVISF